MRAAREQTPPVGTDALGDTSLVSSGMAMTLRLPEDLDRELDRLAAENHTSKSALLVEAARQLVQRSSREALIEQGFQFALSHDREALQRLADA